MSSLTRRQFLAATIAAAQSAPKRRIFVELAGKDPLELRAGEVHETGPLRIDLRQAPVADVYAREPATFNLEWRYEEPAGAAFYSWRGLEPQRVALTQDTGEDDRRKLPAQLFPFAAALAGGTLHGALGDCPAFWENRSQQILDPAAGSFSIRTGDGSPRRVIRKIWGDSTDFYSGEVDGWQHLAGGETRRYRVVEFTETVRTLYGVQLAAHNALARANGWNGSLLEAILRNTAFLHLRRNLLRPESRYIFISGVTYGWKQWASDAAMTALGLGDPEMLAEAVRGLFFDRLNYEDNAQWFLIASALAAREGFRPNLALCRRAWDFLRDHEERGAYQPPRLDAPNAGLGWRTYMDLFYYEDGDVPSSNQGFHCGAHLAARELGLAASEEGFRAACRAYAEIFNARGGFFPTSLRRQDVFGGDALYGAAVTFAAFGRKCLPDELVQRHCRHAMKIRSPFGLRVVCKANGDLLEKDQYGPGNPHGLEPEKAGAYVQGGSWFFCDAGTWLAGLVHGMDPRVVDRLLIERIRVELEEIPAFSESIHTRTGAHHGNVLYGANSLYLWLRRRIRERLGMRGADPVDRAIHEWLSAKGTA
ncbi:MAG: hypothetical protein WHT08_15220 [Bryobacteraceae bacterium]